MYKFVQTRVKSLQKVKKHFAFLVTFWNSMYNHLKQVQIPLQFCQTNELTQSPPPLTLHYLWVKMYNHLNFVLDSVLDDAVVCIISWI